MTVSKLLARCNHRVKYILEGKDSLNFKRAGIFKIAFKCKDWMQFNTSDVLPDGIYPIQVMVLKAEGEWILANDLPLELIQNL